MSYNNNYNNNIPEEWYGEDDSSFFKVKAPIGQLKYCFRALILMAIFTVAAYFIFPFMLKGMLKGSLGLMFVVILLRLILLYPVFVNCAQRLWDITGNKMIGIILAIIVVLVILSMNNFLVNALSLILILFPGKLIKTGM